MGEDDGVGGATDAVDPPPSVPPSDPLTAIMAMSALSAVRQAELSVIPPSPVFSTDRRVRPQDGDEEDETDVPGYMPNSAYALYMSLLPRDRCSQTHWNRLKGDTPRSDDAEVERLGFPFLDCWENEIWSGAEDGERGSGEARVSGGDTETRPPSPSPSPPFAAALDPPVESRKYYGPDALPPGASAQADILLRILRHAASDLQRDHRLARAVLLLLSGIGCFEDDGSGGPERLRRLMSVITADYVRGCDWQCHIRYLDQQGNDHYDPDSDDDDENGGGDFHSRPNHYCHDVSALFFLCHPPRPEFVTAQGLLQDRCGLYCGPY